MRDTGMSASSFLTARCAGVASARGSPAVLTVIVIDGHADWAYER
jgi:hypothetical protein